MYSNNCGNKGFKEDPPKRMFHQSTFLIKASTKHQIWVPKKGGTNKRSKLEIECRRWESKFRWRWATNDHCPPGRVCHCHRVRIKSSFRSWKQKHGEVGHYPQTQQCAKLRLPNRAQTAKKFNSYLWLLVSIKLAKSRDLRSQNPEPLCTSPHCPLAMRRTLKSWEKVYQGSWNFVEITMWGLRVSKVVTFGSER